MAVFGAVSCDSGNANSPGAARGAPSTSRAAAIRDEPTQRAQSAKASEEGRCEHPFEGATVRFDPSAWDTSFCKHNVPYAEIRSGGPPRDGIPPIDDPSFVSVAEANEWIQAREPVIRLAVGSDVRAYPLQVLIWHEIVNDIVGGKPVVVTFCPLCYTSIVFERPEIDGQRLTFGTSGNLRHSDLVMWDRQTESWWQQFTGRAIVGELTGHELARIPAAIVSWEQLAEAHPDARVLSRDTGAGRPYGRNPYAGYEEASRPPFLQTEVADGLPPMARIVGVQRAGVGRAYPLETLKSERAINDELADEPIAVLWRSGTASAVDRRRVSQGRDIGSAAVYRRTLGERTLTFEPASRGRFRDRETGSVWSLGGKAVDGPLEGRALEPVAHDDTFWFVWSTFLPDGEIYGN